MTLAFNHSNCYYVVLMTTCNNCIWNMNAKIHKSVSSAFLSSQKNCSLYKTKPIKNTHPKKKKNQPLLHLLCKIPEKIHYFNHCLNIFCSEHNDSTNRSQSSTEFVLESRSYNKKSLIQISAAAPAAISRKQKRMKCP